MKPVFAIIVTYRRFEFFKQTVESLLPTLPKGSRLLIVDNYSNDAETYRYLVNLGQRDVGVTVHALLLDKNEGWGAAMNEALRLYPVWREYDYVLESNNDITYASDWCERAQAMMENHSRIGVLGLWKHANHGTLETVGNLVVKDQMPACAWLFRSADLAKFLPFPEKGPTNLRGGIGEDTAMCDKIRHAGYWVCGLREDIAQHMDGYDTEAGKENKAYL